MVLFAILVFQVFLAAIPGHAFIVAGGYVYGLVIGSLITFSSTVLASQLAFLLTRRMGQSLVDRLAPRRVIDYWRRIAENQDAVFFLFLICLANLSK